MKKEKLLKNRGSESGKIGAKKKHCVPTWHTHSAHARSQRLTPTMFYIRLVISIGENQKNLQFYLTPIKWAEI